MTPVLIRSENIGKSYVIRHQGKQGWDKNRTLRDELTSAVTNVFRKPKSGADAPTQETFWAVKDISFKIEQGESVGFIGHNGAGKSTLLKLISRITEPTTGELEIAGRVASLLEVGTGFHAELTGRENIYLKGAIMGMKRTEIRARFDEIVEFAEIERFLDTPVKRYSSGMHVKLGFAVAAHLDPEILIVDEVLAVGDAQFQRKCINKMQSIVTGAGKTILFVSHNLGLIQTVCQRAIIMKRGGIIADGPASDVVGQYLDSLENASGQDLAHRTDRTGAGEIRVLKLEASAPACGRPARFVAQLSGVRSATAMSLHILDKDGSPVAQLNSAFSSPSDSFSSALGDSIFCEIDALALIPGQYRVDFHLHVGNVLQDSVRSACTLHVEGGDFGGRVFAANPNLGSACLDHRWILPAGAEA